MTESAQMILIVDDRLVLHHERCKDTLEDELRWVSKLSPYVWEQLAAVAGKGMNGRTLYSLVMRCVFRARAFTQQK